jgi:S-adenosylmethionine:tRNA ribosyltransferase-isomerase
VTSQEHDPLPISRFDYELPPELIAQQPLEPRDAARLLVVGRDDGKLSDCRFTDLPELLRPGDLLVLNDTRVLPARVRARRATGGAVELLLLTRQADGSWSALARPAKRVRAGETLQVLDHRGEITPETLQVIEREADGVRVRFDDEGTLHTHGLTPLPPYIHESLADPERYQTIYGSVEGSAAAPTAGLHFTERVLRACRERGVTIATVTLHVGLDTFQPIRVEDARDHTLHAEWRQVNAATLHELRAARARGARVIGVGTTAVRTLESLPDDALTDVVTGEHSGWTKLYITPGHRFRVVDGMLTNFHLPRTTLLLLVSALAGEATIRRAYEHAVLERYRFYSFGDAMLII